MVCCRGNVVGTELPRLFHLQPRCLQPGMDHAADWRPTCKPHTHSDTSDTSDSTDASDTHSTVADASDAHSTAAHTTHRWLRAREGLQCERMVQRSRLGRLVPSTRTGRFLPSTFLQADLSLAPS